MRRGERISLVVESLAFGGDSLARAEDGRVVFFAGAAPGDRVTLRLDEVKPRFARATLVSVDQVGASHVAPRCPLAGTCGGCQWQEVSIEAQRAAKQSIVERALGRLGCQVTPIISATPSFGYRSRARLTRGANGALGYHARRSHDVIDVPACPLLEPALEHGLRLARTHLAAALPAGASVSLLVGRAGRVHLDVEGDGNHARIAAAIAALARDPSIAGVTLGERAVGQSTLDVSLDGEPAFHSAAGGFAQASHEGNRALRELVVAEARRLLAGVARPRVLELYAGDGNFTRHLCALAEEVVAAEIDHAAAARLPDNAPGPPPPRRLALSAAEAVRRLLAESQRFDLVVLDPPRAGAAEVAALLPLLAPRVLYVSCDPMTLARDAATLAAAGLPPSRATPLDLMPQTSHVETVCAFEPASNPAPAPT